MGQNQSLCPTICSEKKKVNKQVSTISTDSISSDRGSLLSLESDDNIEPLKYSDNQPSAASDLSVIFKNKSSPLESDLNILGATSSINRKSRTADDKLKNGESFAGLDEGTEEDSSIALSSLAHDRGKSLSRSRKTLSIFNPDIDEDTVVEEDKDILAQINQSIVNKARSSYINGQKKSLSKSKKNLSSFIEEPTAEDNTPAKSVAIKSILGKSVHLNDNANGKKTITYCEEPQTFDDDVVPENDIYFNNKSNKSVIDKSRHTFNDTNPVSKSRKSLSVFEESPAVEENEYSANKSKKSILQKNCCKFLNGKRKSTKSFAVLEEQEDPEEEDPQLLEERKQSIGRSTKSILNNRSTLNNSRSYQNTDFYVPKHVSSSKMPNKQLASVMRQSLQDYDQNISRSKSYVQKERCNCRDWTSKRVSNFKDDFEETELSGSDINLQREYSLPGRRKTSIRSKSGHKCSMMMQNTNDVCEVPSSESFNTVNYTCRNSNIGDCEQKPKIEPTCNCKHWCNKHFQNDFRDRNSRLSTNNQRLSCLNTDNTERSDLMIQKKHSSCPRNSQNDEKRYSQVNSERNQECSCCYCNGKNVEPCDSRQRSVCKNNNQRYSKRNSELYSKSTHERAPSEFHSDAEDNYRNSCQRSSKQAYPHVENSKSFNKNYELRRIHSMNQANSCRDGSQMYQKTIQRDNPSILHSKHCTNDGYESAGLSKCQYETDSSSDEEILVEDKKKCCSKKAAPSNYELPYQETEQYEYLVDELENTLAERNKERFRKTLQEFEQMSKNCEDKPKRICNSQRSTIAYALPEIKKTASHLQSKGDAGQLFENNSSDSEQEFNTERNTQYNYSKMNMDDNRSKPNQICCKYCSKELCAKKFRDIKHIPSEIPPEGDDIYEKRQSDINDDLQRKETYRGSFDEKRFSTPAYSKSGFIERKKTQSVNNNSRPFYKQPSRISSSKWEIGPDMEWRKVEEVSKIIPNDRKYSRSESRRFSSNDNVYPTKRHTRVYTNPLQDYVSHENIIALEQNESRYNEPSRPRISKERHSTYRESLPNNEQSNENVFYDGNFRASQRASKNRSKIQSLGKERSTHYNNNNNSKYLFNSNDNFNENQRGTENISRQELDPRSRSRLKTESQKPLSNDWFINMDIPREENRKESYHRRYTKDSDGEF